MLRPCCAKGIALSSCSLAAFCWPSAGAACCLDRSRDQFPRPIPETNSGMKTPRPARANGAQLRLAADIGGTFTDIALFDDRTGKLAFGKALSVPQRLVEGINAGVAKAGSDYCSAGL